MAKLTIHMIGNAHLDPVWLWPWPAGVDEAINTCRTACDLLDEYPEFVVTRGEAWVHEQVRLIAPDVFERIKVHAAAGRWAVVNGWWVQPDCNLPSAASFRKQGEIGKAWFQEHLGVDVKVGYNVDSFGHTAMLPRFLKDTGFDSYVFMRPGPEEKELPADLFTWQAPDGASIPTFRIRPEYTVHSVDRMEQMLPGFIEEARKGPLSQTMYFYGVGDHGGGPTRAQIEWILAHQQYADDVELIFSSPAAFFEAVSKEAPELPVVTEELQFHAVGCYSVVHDIKCANREGQTMCERAESFAPDRAAELQPAWERVLFNQFHDILAGSSIKESYDHARDELGQAAAMARDCIVQETRRKSHALDPTPDQRMVIYNTGKRAFTGLAYMEPWMYYSRRQRPSVFRSADGELLPSQDLPAAAAVGGMRGFLVPVAIPPGEAEVLSLEEGEASTTAKDLTIDPDRLANQSIAAEISAAGIKRLQFNSEDVIREPGIRLEVFEDATDTWSHGIAGYEGESQGVFTSEDKAIVRETGPLRARLTKIMTWGRSEAVCSVSLEAGYPCLRLKLRLNWSGRNQIVKLVIPPAFEVVKRVDRVPEAFIERPCNGWEYPVEHAVSLIGADAAVTAVSTNIFSADVQADGTLRLTLLRCPPYAHHDPLELQPGHDYPFTDQGEHVYEAAVLMQSGRDDEMILDELYRQSRPLETCEVTHGMQGRS